MSASLVNVSDRRFKRPNLERRAREERRFQAELAARSTPALAVRTVVATPEAQKRGKRRGKPQKRLSKKRRETKRGWAAAQAPPRDVIGHPSPPSASSSAGCFKLPPLAPPEVPSWTSTISALNQPPIKELPTAVELFHRQLLRPPDGDVILIPVNESPEKFSPPPRKFLQKVKRALFPLNPGPSLAASSNSEADLAPL